MKSPAPFFLVGIALLFAGAQTIFPAQPRQLTMAQRVAYQYAIEEVYWRHRIWPKENRGPKPLLDEVMSRADVERKIEDYLRNSQLLADQRHRPITPDQLQAEMDRMASHTKQPDVLRELFAGLNNDPYVIAECLARPVLADRLTASLSGGAGVLPAATNSFAADTAASTEKDSAAYTLSEISPQDCVDDTWTPTSTINAPTGRYNHTAVWTGSEMIVWGGLNGTDFFTGGRYSPATDTWMPTRLTNAPLPRDTHSAVWTGSEMIVWGGYGNGNYFVSGGRYNPITNNWIATSTINAPTGRYNHTAVWTGSEMIVWGGYGNGNYFVSGGRYNPVTDTWIATSTTNAPTGRINFTAVWTGSEMIVWGGLNGTDLDTGGRYNPNSDSWTATTTTNAPSNRDSHTAVWTGSEMIAWGGYDGSSFLNTGGRYNPIADSWISTSTTSTPAGREYHTAVWTGFEMIVWGGLNGTDLDTGARYDPKTNGWTATGSSATIPDARERHTAVWTGNQMILWGGRYSGQSLNSGGQYCAQPSAAIVQSAVSRKTHGSAGSFDVNLPLSGTPGIECRSGGATNDYTLVVTFLANVLVNGNPQAAITSGTGDIGSGGVGNGGTVTVSGNVVTVPLTNVANAQTINVTLYDVNGAGDVVIPMSVLVGDTNANGTVNAADVAQTKARLGQTVDATNFRSDVNANGSINAGDTAIVKQNSGMSLPP